MDPLSAIIGAGGLALQIYGAHKASEVAQQRAQVSAGIAATEQQQDAVRRQAMELSASRQSMEVLRNAQRARSVALTNATGQGAQYGSGLQGGYAQISGQQNWNLLGISQNRQFGESMFDLTNQIDQSKIQLAQLGGDAASAQGLESLGGDITKSAGTLSNIGKSGFSALSSMFGQ